MSRRASTVRTAIAVDKELGRRGLCPMPPPEWARGGAGAVDAHTDLAGLPPWRVERIAWLADIAAYLLTSDPIEIGAGALLESSGHQRGQGALFA
jgi:hypothetical protein